MQMIKSNFLDHDGIYDNIYIYDILYSCWLIRNDCKYSVTRNQWSLINKNLFDIL